MLNSIHKSLTVAFLVLSIFIFGLNADRVWAQTSVPEPMAAFTPEEKAWLAKHPDVTFGFTDSFEPFLIRNAGGQHAGILIDLLQKLNAQLGTRFALEVDSWPVILEKVKKRRWGAFWVLPITRPMPLDY